MIKRNYLEKRDYERERENDMDVDLNIDLAFMSFRKAIWKTYYVKITLL